MASTSADDIKVDLKNFAKKTVKQFRRASKMKFAQKDDDSDLGDDASTTSSTASDMEKVMEEDNGARLSWGVYDGKVGGDEKGKDKDCSVM